MKLLSGIFSVAFTLVLTLFVITSPVKAAVAYSITPPTVDENSPPVTITFTGLPSGQQFKICTDTLGGQVDQCSGNTKIVTAVNNEVSIVACADSPSELKFAPDCSDRDFFHAGDSNDRYEAHLLSLDGEHVLTTAEIDAIHVFPLPPNFSTQNPAPGQEITITLTGSVKRPPISADHDGWHCRRNDYELIIKNESGSSPPSGTVTLSQDCSEPYQSFTFPPLEAGSYLLKVNDKGGDFTYWAVPFTVEVGGGTISAPVKDPEGKDAESGGGGPPVEGRNPCDTNNDGVSDTCPTALGDISTDISSFSSQFLSIAIGIAGGIALVLLVIGSIRVLVSAGNQQALAGGRDMIIAAVAGLLFLIFSILILKFIGLKILGGII